MVSSLAIDIGSHAVRGLWLRDSHGQLEVAAAMRGEPGEGITSALLAELKKQGAPLRSITLGIPGEIATLRYNLLPPVPPWRLELILKYETEELAEKSGEALTHSYIRLDIPESAVEDQILLIGLGKNVPIEARIQELEKSGGRVSRAIPAAIALYHAYRAAFAGGKEENVLLADVGAQETQIVLVLGGRLVFARSANFGGNQIDEMIAGALNIKVEVARRLKEGARDGKDPAGLLEGAQSVIRSALGQLFSILQSSVTFCRTQVKLRDFRLDRVLLSGGAAQLPVLRTYLEERFHTQVDLLRPQVTGTLPGGAPEEWVIAIGLAVAQLGKESALIDLLPPVPRARRDFRERTVFMYGAAAALLVSVLLYFGIGYFLNHAVNAQAELLENASADIAQLQRQCDEADEVNAKVQRKLDRVHREILQTTFTAQILQALRTLMPSPVSIEKLTTTVVPQEDGEILEVVIEGKADDSDRKAIVHFKELKDALARLPRVRRVIPDLGEVQQGNRPFRLVISPDKDAPAAKKGVKQ